MGMFTGLGIMFLAGCAVFGLFRLLFQRERQASETEFKILYGIVVGIWYMLWFNGPTSWFFEGDLDIPEVFASALLFPVEIASGTEYLFNLEPGTLGGYDWVLR